MTIENLLEVALNLARHGSLLLLGLVLYFEFRQSFLRYLPRGAEPFFYGLAFGVLAAISALLPVEVYEGVGLSLHVPFIVLATVYGGFRAGAMTTGIAAVTVVLVSLPAVIPIRVLVAVAAFGFATLALVRRRRRETLPGWPELVALGAAVGALGPAAGFLWPATVTPPDLARVIAPIWGVTVFACVIFLGLVVRHFERSEALTKALASSEERFRTLYNETPVMMTAATIEGRIVAASDRWLRTLGYERGEVLGRPYGELIAGSSLEKVLKERLPALRSAGRAEETELQLVRRDGTLVDVTSTSIVRPHPVTGAPEILSFMVDQSERKRAEAELQQRERDLLAITDNAPIAISLKDRDLRYRLVNRCLEEWSERPHDFIGRTDAEIYPPWVAERTIETDRLVLEEGKVVQVERPTMQTRKEIEHFLVTKFPVRDTAGAVAGIACFMVDVSARVRAEKALRESRELLIESQRLGQMGYILTDFASGRAYWSDTMFELRQVPRRDFFTFDESFAFVHPDDQPRLLEVRQQAIAERRDFEIEVRVIRGDGAVRWEYGKGRPQIDANGNVVGLLLLLIDITESKRIAAALQQSEERFRALVEHSNDMLAVLGRDGVITFASPSAVGPLGYGGDAIVGRRLRELFHPDDVPGLRERFEEIVAAPNRRAAGRARIRHNDGSWRHVAWIARNALDVPGVEGVIVSARDVTEAWSLEQQLLQAQKMEAVGQLAGGIAHDFNNILGAILGFAGFLSEDLAKGTPEREFADRILLATERARGLVRQILAFSRPATGDRRPCDLVPLLSETKDLLRGPLPRTTRLSLMVETPDLVCDVDPAQISQILFNICLNANDALGGAPGDVSIVASRLDAVRESEEWERRLPQFGDGVGEAERLRIGTLKPGCSYARITVSDTGAGIAPEILKRLFEPFFTTKGRAQGAGLGLPVVHGILKAYDAACQVVSRPGIGTTFTILLPLAPEGRGRAEAAERPKALRGREHILVVDDEVMLTDVLSIGLGRLGYEVAATDDPREALEIFREQPEAWDVVVSDQVMPHMTGLDMLAAMRAVRPDVRFILCTGYSDGATEEVATSAGANAFFLKPVAPARIAATIRDLCGPASGVLGAPAAPA